MKPERGEIWANIHTKTRTKIINRIAFNIQHEHMCGNIGPITVYTHFRTFQKNWCKVEE